MSCPAGEVWTAYADGETPRAELRELEAHLAGCPDCRSLVVALREETGRELRHEHRAGIAQPNDHLGVVVDGAILEVGRAPRGAHAPGREEVLHTIGDAVQRAAIPAGLDLRVGLGGFGGVAVPYELAERNRLQLSLLRGSSYEALKDPNDYNRISFPVGEQVDPALAGLNQRSPLLAATMTLAMVSLAGIPPTAGFIGKFYVFMSAVEAGMTWLAVLALIFAAVSAYYYLRLVLVMYMREPDAITADSPRLILWKVYARTRRLFVRTSERALEAAPRTCAYLVADPQDEAAATLARTVLERGLLGDRWRFGADYHC